MTQLDLHDIQGHVLRQYPLPSVRHLLLKVVDPDAARAALGQLANGDPGSAPQVSDATEAPTATYRLHLGITSAGLAALGVTDRVPQDSFRSFPAFVAGAAQRAPVIGDAGQSAPEHWIGGFGTGDDHVLVTLYTDTQAGREDYSQRLLALLTQPDAFQELWLGDGDALNEQQDGRTVSKVHFGYVDGISQPTIRGGPEPGVPDGREPCEPWLFVLCDDAPSYYLPDPPALGRNGSFAVFKVMQQDVAGFEAFLQSQRDLIDPELLAAKVCGRWRNGAPLALSPDSDMPPGGIAAEQLNDFEYVRSDWSGDPRGVRTPIGSHIRRVNPRGQPVKGQSRPGGTNNDHRIIRRGIPYGPTYDPSQPDDGVERGLLGVFINSRIENQFEFVMREWINNYEFVGALRLDPHAKGVITATHEAPDNVFDIPRPEGDAPLRITGFSSFVTTRATAYCFLPSLTALRFIAKL